MEMMSCPHCGAQNSSKREYCYQCEGDLQAPPAPAPEQKQKRDYVPTCASCALAAIYAPPGVQLSTSEVYCTKQEKAVSADMVAGSCFSEAFGWRRDEILD